MLLQNIETFFWWSYNEIRCTDLALDLYDFSKKYQLSKPLLYKSKRPLLSQAIANSSKDTMKHSIAGTERIIANGKVINKENPKFGSRLRSDLEFFKSKLGDFIWVPATIDAIRVLRGKCLQKVQKS